MLLSAGMGIGLMFWSVAEPMFHYGTPIADVRRHPAGTPEAAQVAWASPIFIGASIPGPSTPWSGSLAFFASTEGCR